MKNLFKLLIISNLLFSISSCGSDKLTDLSETVYLRRNGADMPAHVFGNGAEKIFIIILHGGPGGDGFSYRVLPFIDDLEKKYAMVYYDQRGQGMAQGKYKKDAVSVDEMVKDVVALTQVLKHKYGADCQFFLMGHSWGGTLGTALMITENQHLFKGWIEVAGAHDLPQLNRALVRMFYEIGDQQIALNQRVEFWEKAQKTASEQDTTQEEMDVLGEMNELAHQAEGHLADAGLIDEPKIKIPFNILVSSLTEQTNQLTSSITGNVTQVILADKGLETISFTDQLHQIQIPTLLLWGKYDFVVPKELGETAYQKIGSDAKKLVIFERSAHSPMNNEPDNFNAEVINFIELYKN